jgi:hypothetical protein
VQNIHSSGNTGSNIAKQYWQKKHSLKGPRASSSEPELVFLRKKEGQKRAELEEEKDNHASSNWLDPFLVVPSQPICR